MGLNRKEKICVALIVIGGFTTMINMTVMSPALPSVMKELDIGPATGQWLTSIFLLVNGLMIPITAYLIGRFSTRKLFISSMIAFTIGSTVAALSPNFTVLLIGRILQAVGAGIQLPFGSVMLMLIFPKNKRGFALGLAGIVIGFAPAIGPTLAGWVVDALGWKYIFACITPLAAIVLIFAAIFLKNYDTRQESKLDILSVVLSTLGFGGLLFGFSVASGVGWLSPITILCIVGGAGCIALFVRRQFKLDIPLLDLRILQNKVFATSTILCMIISSGLTVAAVMTPIFLQNVLGNSALHSGLTLMPGALLMAALSPVAGSLFDKFGPRALAIAGISIITIGTGMLSLLRPTTPTVYILIAYTFRMAGISFVNMPINTWGINALETNRIAHGNAINNTARQVAGSIGTAVLITVMTLVSKQSEDLDTFSSTTYGIDAAFSGATALTLLALALAIAKVHSMGSKSKKHKKHKEDE